MGVIMVCVRLDCGCFYWFVVIVGLGCYCC